MRTFEIGHGRGRKFVTLEVDGTRVRVTKGNAGGTTGRSGKDLPDEAEALAECEKVAGELAARGYVERGVVAPTPAPPPPRKAHRSAPSTGLLDLLAEAGEDDSEPVEEPPPRRGPSPAGKPPVAAKKKTKKRRAQGRGDALDRRVIGLFGAAGVAGVAFLGFLFYAAFLKPPSIVGHWEGSRTEHEIGKFLTNTQYVLVLDDRKRATMAIQGGTPSAGTYALQGDRLRLTFQGDPDEAGLAGGGAEDDEEAAPAGPVEVHREYRVVLGGSTLDLYDVETGKKLVQLIRFHQSTAAGRGPGTRPPAAPKDLAAPPGREADAALASVQVAAPDRAFALRHPPGWQVESGGRPDNTYSWVRLTKGSAKVQVSADIAGSLTSGAVSGDYEPGSPLAPVHGAHERARKAASESYSDYKESEPAAFPGSGLGEGRVATFTASTGGLLGSKLAGLRITLLTNDRRISILCEAPPREFERLKATFLAIGRSLSR